VNPATGLAEQVVTQAAAVRAALAEDAVLGRFVDSSLPNPQPYLGAGPIRLIIIGQDPTVQNVAERARIRTVLNLDKPGSLLRYVASLCQDLGVSLRDEVYATNACKNFWRRPPRGIQEADVLALSSPFWLPVLRDEMDHFPQAVVISLGKPVLSMLVRDGCSREVRHYWGYHPRWQGGSLGPLRAIEPEDSMMGRRIYPFVHQQTQSEFYRVHRPEYVAFIRRALEPSASSQTE
jgi:uracil-DNA glycosylase